MAIEQCTFNKFSIKHIFLGWFLPSQNVLSSRSVLGILVAKEKNREGSHGMSPGVQKRKFQLVQLLSAAHDGMSLLKFSFKMVHGVGKPVLSVMSMPNIPQERIVEQ